MLLGGAKSSYSIDQSMYINVDLSGKSKLFKKTKIDETMDLYSLYKSEKDSCTRYRMLFVINPVCTNILFNRKTEIVAFEGSDKCVALSDYAPLDSIVGTGDTLYSTINNRGKNDLRKKDLYLCNAIKDTEFSHPDLGNLTYHCGADICNNHILRSKDFSFSNHITAKSNSLTCFNTISDIVRTEAGVEETNFVGLTPKVELTSAHMYGIDTIMTFSESFLSNLYEKDGWFGFDNSSNINIDNVEYEESRNKTKTISVNRVINNIGPCSFVDLYPDRTLFSAVPKYNNYRHRQEHNWDYCLTYPYSNEKEKLYEINGHIGDPADTGYLGMKMVVEKVIRSNSGEKAILFKTSINHNLHIGRYINLYMQKPGNGSYETVTYEDRIQVIGVGTEAGFDKEKYFAVRESDMPSEIYLIELPEETFYSTNDKGTGGRVLFSYRNNVNNMPCDYYIRKFKKIKSPEVDETTGEYKNLTYDVSKIAFGTNIYGDDMAQIIFNEDVDLKGLLDNRGREVSEIFLTIIKTNRGHDLWYKRSSKNNKIEKVKEETKNKRDESIEYSHCFGKVTSGIEVNDDSEDYNVCKLHNIDTEKIVKSARKITGVHNGLSVKLTTDSKAYITGTKDIFGNITPPKTIEDDITIDSTDEFFGDIVEFNPNDYTETVLGKIYYRFNTEQRECYYNEEYFNIFYDEIVQDDFDGISIEGYSGNVGKERKFKVETKLQNIAERLESKGCSNSSSSEVKNKYYLMAGNLDPEGYYYSPHNRIVVKELADEASEASVDKFNIDTDDFTENFVVLNKDNTANSIAIVRVLSTRLYNFQKGENVMFYNKETQKTVFGTIDTVLGRQSIFVKVRQNDAIDEIINIKDGNVTIDTSLLPKSTIGFEPDNGGVYKIKSNVLVLYTNIAVPSYAIFRASTSSYIWRGTMNISDVTSASTLYNIPFSNGAIYLEKNVNLFLKRQDPRATNYLYNYDERPSEGSRGDSTSSSASTFLQKEGMPKLDLRYLLEGDIDITLDLC